VVSGRRRARGIESVSRRRACSRQNDARSWAISAAFPHSVGQAQARDPFCTARFSSPTDGNPMSKSQFENRSPAHPCPRLPREQFAMRRRVSSWRDTDRPCRGARPSLRLMAIGVIGMTASPIEANLVRIIFGEPAARVEVQARLDQRVWRIGQRCRDQTPSMTDALTLAHRILNRRGS